MMKNRTILQKLVATLICLFVINVSFPAFAVNSNDKSKVKEKTSLAKDEMKIDPKTVPIDEDDPMLSPNNAELEGKSSNFNSQNKKVSSNTNLEKRIDEDEPKK